MQKFETPHSCQSTRNAPPSPRRCKNFSPSSSRHRAKALRNTGLGRDYKTHCVLRLPHPPPRLLTLLPVFLVANYALTNHSVQMFTEQVKKNLHIWQETNEPNPTGAGYHLELALFGSDVPTLNSQYPKCATCSIH